MGSLAHETELLVSQLESVFLYCLMGAGPRPHLILIVDCTESNPINIGTPEGYTEATADSRGILTGLCRVSAEPWFKR